MGQPQPGILAEVPAASRYLFFSARPDGDVRASLLELATRTIDESLVIGIGAPTIAALGVEVEGLRAHPSLVGPGLTVPSTQSGESFVAVQRWLHDLDRLEAMPPEERDSIVGRRLADNEEIEDAPASAHVKRTAQESFSPPAFVLRRSMPWSDPDGEGLVFVAFGRRFDAYEALLQRMVGIEDGISDALFRFTRPVSGSYFWCPPLADGRLALGF